MERTIEGSCSRLQEPELPHGFCCSLRPWSKRFPTLLWICSPRITMMRSQMPVISGSLLKITSTATPFWASRPMMR
jgi:hypothetical protein